MTNNASSTRKHPDPKPPVKRKQNNFPGPGPGRPKGSKVDTQLSRIKRDLASECREHADKALRTLLRLLDKADSDAVSLGAARELLDRGFGRPIQSVQGQINVKHEVNGARDELEQRLHRIIDAEAIEDVPERSH